MIRFEHQDLWTEVKTTGTELYIRNWLKKDWRLSQSYATLEQLRTDYILYGWKEVKAGIDPNDLQGLDQALWGKPCCPGTNGNGPTFYKNGAWHQGDCTEMAPATTIDLQKDFRDGGSKKGICTCGSAAVGSDRHSHWCDVK